MFSPGTETTFSQRLRAAGIDIDAVNVIVGAGRWPDLPDSLGDSWAARWDGAELQALAALSADDRQHFLAREVDRFLQDPAVRLSRVIQALHSADPDEHAAGAVAHALLDLLTGFGREVTTPARSHFTGKLKYGRVTDLDVETTRAIIEVSTAHSASGKVGQLADLVGSTANPGRLPVFHYMPNLAPNSLAAQALRAAGSAGVYNDLAALVAAVRTLP